MFCESFKTAVSLWIFGESYLVGGPGSLLFLLCVVRHVCLRLLFLVSLLCHRRYVGSSCIYRYGGHRGLDKFLCKWNRGSLFRSILRVLAIRSIVPLDDCMEDRLVYKLVFSPSVKCSRFLFCLNSLAVHMLFSPSVGCPKFRSSSCGRDVVVVGSGTLVIEEQNSRSQMFGCRHVNTGCSVSCGWLSLGSGTLILEE